MRIFQDVSHVDLYSATEMFFKVSARHSGGSQRRQVGVIDLAINQIDAGSRAGPVECDKRHFGGVTAEREHRLSEKHVPQ